MLYTLAAEILGPEIDLTGVVVEDEAAHELEGALNKARRLKQKHRVREREHVVAERVLLLGQDDDVDEVDEAPQSLLLSENKSTNIMLNSTSEFCRSLGEIPTYGQAGNRNEEEEDELLVSTGGTLIFPQHLLFKTCMLILMGGH